MYETGRTPSHHFQTARTKNQGTGPLRIMKKTLIMWIPRTVDRFLVVGLQRSTMTSRLHTRFELWSDFSCSWNSYKFILCRFSWDFQVAEWAKVRRLVATQLGKRERNNGARQSEYLQHNVDELLCILVIIHLLQILLRRSWLLDDNSWIVDVSVTNKFAR